MRCIQPQASDEPRGLGNGSPSRIWFCGGRFVPFRWKPSIAPQRKKRGDRRLRPSLADQGGHGFVGSRRARAIMTLLPYSNARPVLLMFLIVIALMLRNQTDSPTTLLVVAKDDLPADRPLHNLSSDARPCPNGPNRSANRTPDPSATNTPRSKDTL